MKTLFLSLSIVLSSSLFAQQPVSSHVPWTKEDSAAINALVLYPDSIRLEIFQACEYPAIIVNVASLQKNTSAAFADAINGYPRTEQEDIWNLSRYPGLIDKLANSASDNELNTILADYPTDIHDSAMNYAKNHQDDLKKVDAIQTSANSQFDQLISSYPADVQRTFRDLLQYPEIMSLLNDHLSLTVRVGDHYKRDPERVIRKADSNNLVQVRQNAQEVQQWKQTIQNDTAAQNELKSAANEYADSNGYNANDVSQPTDSNAVENYSTYPYSYWFGYPTWYPYAYWYPRPYWYDWGFYYGPHGHMVVFGTPSFYFTNWYFYYPHHWDRYPHLGSVYINHYYGTHRPYNENSLIVRQWVANNREYLPRDFTTSRTSRVETIKEVGQLHEAVQRQGEPASAVERNEYLQKNSSRFPTLNNRPEQATIPEEREVPNAIQHPERQPAVVPRQQSNVSNPNSRTRPAPNYNTVNRAQTYHQNVWQNTQPRYSAPARSYSAPARSYSAPAPSRGGGGGGGRR